jgi:phosphopantothenoylcysteine decarboxylase/phosphopantothenate--cysteine ligase
MLSGKKILLGVTGSIAAYKSTYLVRLLIKAGAEVKVILSPAARDFVTPLSLSTLSKNPVLWEYFDAEDEEGKWNHHVNLALWADLMIIAPATANTLSKMAHGQSDNFLMGVYMSAKCPVYFAPAMDLDMHKHAGTQANIKKLVSFGHMHIPSEKGELASGLSGEGRMSEPENIVTFLQEHLTAQAPLQGKKLLINAGPTYEAIDPVRFIGNHSSGKMGYALTQAALSLGAEVHLVIGPNHLDIETHEHLRVSHVRSAQDMLEQCTAAFEDVDIAILSAAVADYRPAEAATHKIKKSSEKLQIDLVKTPDVLWNLGQQKKAQVLVGFALETQNAEENARKKLHKKNCDLIVLNMPNEKGTGFGHNTNAVTLIDKDGSTHPLTLKSKQEIAHEIFQYLRKHHL